jgi:hypothetical protein
MIALYCILAFIAGFAVAPVARAAQGFIAGAAWEMRRVRRRQRRRR